jgi:Tfp pilus assembly PilM family ATPase
LAARRIGRLDALVGVGRSSVELRQMSMPPVPDDELPDLVRFQALREFGALEEDWPLDYLPLDNDPSQARNVLAAAINPRQVEEIREGCEAAGVKLSRLVLRPASAASLVLRRSASATAEVRLLVELLPEEADLTVLLGHKVVFLRCARLSADPLTVSPQTLVSEIRLTMAAAQNQLAGKRVEQIVIFGSGQPHTDLARTIAQQLATPTELFDPFEGLSLEGELRKQLPEPRGRFAAVLGMLANELAEEPQAFDFLHPRQRPEPPNRRNTYTLAGLAAGLLVLLVLLASWYQRSEGRAALVRLQAESKALDKKVTQANKLVKEAEEIDKWLADEIIWLDEFRWLSEKFPPAEDAMLTQLKMGVSSKQGEMVLDGLARNVDAVKRLDNSLHDERRRMAGKTKGEHKSGSSYDLQFRSSLLVTPAKP